MRCFVALDLPLRLREAIAELQKDVSEPALKPVEPENLHITLKFLGDVPEGNISKIIDGLKAVRQGPLTLGFRDMGVFPNIKYIKVIWIGIEGQITELESLVRTVDNICQPFIEFRDRHSFSPHLTIARAKEHPSAQLLAKLDKHKEINLGDYVFEDFQLKKSTLTPKGPIYENLAVFPL